MTKLIVDEKTDFIDEPDVDVLFKDDIAFSQFIERKSVASNVTRMQAIFSFCEERLLDVDDITHLISPQLKEKIKVEMIKTGMVKSDISSLDEIDG